MTKVKFYKDKDGDIFAYFPEIPGTNEPGVFTCYSHIGQHSACHRDYLRGKRLATPEQYTPLLNELKGQGYDDLIVLNGGISAADQRKIDIEAGKIFQVYPDNEKDDILFEGSRRQCNNFVRINCPNAYLKGKIRIGKLIYENVSNNPV